MIRKTTILGGVMCAAFVAACSSSSNTTSTTKDAGEEKDTGKPGTDAGTSPHVLVTYNGTTSKTTPSTMVAVNLATKRIDGKLSVADSEAITDTSNASAPFILEQTLDVASRIDPATWTTKGSWNIPGPLATRVLLPIRTPSA